MWGMRLQQHTTSWASGSSLFTCGVVGDILPGTHAASPSGAPVRWAGGLSPVVPGPFMRATAWRTSPSRPALLRLPGRPATAVLNQLRPTARRSLAPPRSAAASPPPTTLCRTTPLLLGAGHTNPLVLGSADRKVGPAAKSGGYLLGAGSGVTACDAQGGRPGAPAPQPPGLRGGRIGRRSYISSLPSCSRSLTGRCLLPACSVLVTCS
jgi:hypothetical protein